MSLTKRTPRFESALQTDLRGSTGEIDPGLTQILKNTLEGKFPFVRPRKHKLGWSLICRFVPRCIRKMENDHVHKRWRLKVKPKGTPRSKGRLASVTQFGLYKFLHERMHHLATGCAPSQNWKVVLCGITSIQPVADYSKPEALWMCSQLLLVAGSAPNPSACLGPTFSQNRSPKWTWVLGVSQIHVKTPTPN